MEAAGSSRGFETDAVQTAGSGGGAAATAAVARSLHSQSEAPHGGVFGPDERERHLTSGYMNIIGKSYFNFSYSVFKCLLCLCHRGLKLVKS